MTCKWKDLSSSSKRRPGVDNWMPMAYTFTIRRFRPRFMLPALAAIVIASGVLLVTNALAQPAHHHTSPGAHGGTAAAGPVQPTYPGGKVRTYYIAADRVAWDYAPAHSNLITGKRFGETENVFVKRGTHRIGSKYLKSLYRQYTDATFKHLALVPPQWRHLGFLGPTIQAEVGDTIVVNFKNNTPFRASMHPHGVFYNKDSEGAIYNDGTSGKDKADDAVKPGATHTYGWQVPERAGPGPGDESSVMWMYHGHTDEVARHLRRIDRHDDRHRSAGWRKPDGSRPPTSTASS